MGIYILNDIALRSWHMVPFAYYMKSRPTAGGLSEDEFALLCRCDGETELPESELVNSLLKRGLIRVAATGERISDWQQPRICANRYFPRAIWSITGKCNMNCRHCFMAADNSHIMGEFSRDEWQNTLAQMDDCGIQSITLTGGEPMLHPDFMDIVREVHRRGMVVDKINTNGTFITEAMLDELIAMGAHPEMKISFDGIGHHDWLRQHDGAEQCALDAIRLCKSKGFDVFIQLNVHRGNLDTLRETAQVLGDIGADTFRIIRTTESPRWVENAGDATLTFEEYYDNMLEFAEWYASSGLNMTLIIWQMLDIYPRGCVYHCVPVQRGLCGYRDSLPVCAGNRGMIAIAANGELSPCLQMSGYFENRGIHLGNVKTTPLHKLLTSGDYLDAVTCTLGKLHEKNPTCGACEYRKLCQGGCRAVAMALTGDYLGIDPSKCLFFKQGYLAKTAAVFKRVSNATGSLWHTNDVTDDTARPQRSYG